MPQIFDVIANENGRYKRNELDFFFYNCQVILGIYNKNSLELSYSTVRIFK